MRKNSVFNQENSYLNSWYNITKGFGEFFKERSADLEITPAEAMLLSKIYYKDGISQREIAHSLIVSEANITKTFKKLEGKELVYNIRRIRWNHFWRLRFRRKRKNGETIKKDLR